MLDFVLDVPHTIHLCLDITKYSQNIQKIQKTKYNLQKMYLTAYFILYLLVLRRIYVQTLLTVDAMIVC